MCYSGEFSVNGGQKKVATTGYIVPANTTKKPVDVPGFWTLNTNEVKDVVDKEGVVRKGVVVTDEKTPKVDKAKVEAFIAKVKNAASDDAHMTKLLANLDASDIISSSGVLNPDFTLNEKGEIMFKNKAQYLEKLANCSGEDKEYFETSTGQWARDPDFDSNSYNRLITWGAEPKWGLPVEPKPYKPTPYTDDVRRMLE